MNTTLPTKRPDQSNKVSRALLVSARVWLKGYGSIIAASTPGLGRVTVITDSGWITDDALSGKGIGPVAIKEHDNWEIFLRLANWTAGSVTAKTR